MLSKLTTALSALKAKLPQSPARIFTTRENVMIIQLFPKKQAISVSYKGQVRKGRFDDDTIKRMLKGGKHFEKDTFSVFGAVVRLIEPIIKLSK
jgi:hypothetical protein